MRTLEFADGSRLSYIEVGSPDGEPAFFFHGFPGSSKQILIAKDSEILRRYRLIAIDRPGFGDSSRAGASDWESQCRRVLGLADHLGFQKFHLLAVSGGAPLAFVVADRARSRVKSLTVMCGLGPLGQVEFMREMNLIARWGLRIGSKSPALAARVLGAVHRRFSSGRELNYDRMRRWLPEEDVQVLANPDWHETLRESMKHAFRQGPRGPAEELSLLQSDWGIRDWNFPFPVRLWHGEKDRIVPIAHSQMLAQRIPGAVLKTLPEGHYSLPIRRFHEILKSE